MMTQPQAVRISFRREDFQIDYERPFWPVAAATLLLAESLSLLPGTSPVPHLLFIVPALVLGFCAAALWAMARWYRLRVGPDGIDWHDLWLQPRHTRWSSIENSQRVNILGLEYLRLQTTQSPWAIWVPLFVTRYAQLRDLLVTYAETSQQLDSRLDEVY